MESRRVLILESEAAIAWIVEDLLSFVGYTVVTAAPRTWNMEVGDGGDFDAVLIGLDCRGTFVEGWQAAEHFARPSPALPLIMLTTSDAALGEVGVTERGQLFRAALLKPFRGEDLLAVLDKLLGAARAPQPAQVEATPSSERAPAFGAQARLAA